MLIGFCGNMQVGKTECAKVFKEFEKINFKDALILEIKRNFPDLLELLQVKYSLKLDELFLKKPSLIRKLMQNYGTNVRRNDDKNYWVKKWQQLYDVYNHCNVVVDDVRFINEANIIKRNNGIIIKIYRNGYNGDSHISEQENNLIAPDYVIYNDGTIKDLYKALYEIQKVR